MQALLKYIGIAACCSLLALTAQAAPARVVDGAVIMRQPMRENLCAITFDDGPSVNTPQLLDMLAEYGIPATFFLLGSQAERHPDTVRRILAEGHEVGNHSYSHPNLRLASPERKAEEIRRTDAVLRSLGAAPVFLRPPYGAFDAYTEKVAGELGLSILLWSLDSRDWQRLPANYATLRSTLGTVYQPGTLRGIFLFHDTHKRTVDDLPRIIRDLRAGGCQRFVTVSDYLEGLLDPEPGMLMTRRTPRPLPPADAEMPAAAHEVHGVRQAEELPPASYPAGSTPCLWPAAAALGCRIRPPQPLRPQHRDRLRHKALLMPRAPQRDDPTRRTPDQRAPPPRPPRRKRLCVRTLPRPCLPPALACPPPTALPGRFPDFFSVTVFRCSSPHREVPRTAPTNVAGAVSIKTLFRRDCPKSVGSKNPPLTPFGAKKAVFAAAGRPTSGPAIPAAPGPLFSRSQRPPALPSAAVSASAPAATSPGYA